VKKIAWLGLGLIGLPMASRLAANKASLFPPRNLKSFKLIL
jgi:3-hydroxyisobutyrate dehydrogenase-like beta-hydroxyacid dehydrogenase